MAVSPASQPQFFQNPNIPLLNSIQKDFCDKDLTTNELLKTLQSFKKNKSPGLDGLSAEFFLKFWHKLKDKLIAVYKESFSKGLLPECMRVGVVTLLEKKGKDRIDIANWRPITLLNTDYKLLTKLLGERLKIVLSSLIHPNQNGFVPGGSIFFSFLKPLGIYCFIARKKM